MATKLILGRQPGAFELRYLVGQPWSDGVIYKEDGVPAPWPSAPVIDFVGNIPSITAVLSENGARADWSMNQEQIEALHALHDKRTRFVVDGVVWFAGKARAYD